MVKKWFLVFILFAINAGADEGCDSLFRDFGEPHRYVRASLEGRVLEEERTLSFPPVLTGAVELLSRPQAGEMDARPTRASFLKDVPESVLMRVFKDKDGRKPVDRPARSPLYRLQAQLSITFPRGLLGGSGTLIGPRHILTAGHNLYSPEEGWAIGISVSCALSGTYCPFGKQRVIRAYTYKQWVEGILKDYDLALLVLDTPLKDREGRRIGWYGLSAYKDDDMSPFLLGREVVIAGYPQRVDNTYYPEDEGDQEFSRMWEMSNKGEDGEVIPLGASATQLYYPIDTSQGQSGSAVWYLKEGKPYVMGVHAYGGEEGGRVGNHGVRITGGKLRRIIQWMSETYDVDESAAAYRPPEEREGPRGIRIKQKAGRDTKTRVEDPTLYGDIDVDQEAGRDAEVYTGGK